MNKTLIYIAISIFAFGLLLVAGGYVYTRYQENNIEAKKIESNHLIDSLKNENNKLQLQNELDKKDYQLALARDSLYTKSLEEIAPRTVKAYKEYQSLPVESHKTKTAEWVKQIQGEMK